MKKIAEKYSNIERELIQEIIVCLSKNYNNIIKKESDEDPTTDFEGSLTEEEEKNQVDLTRLVIIFVLSSNILVVQIKG